MASNEPTWPTLSSLIGSTDIKTADTIVFYRDKAFFSDIQVNNLDVKI